MRIGTLLAAIALGYGLWFGTAMPQASADSAGMNGVYNYRDDNGVTATWTITTTCSPGCVAHVTTGPGRGFAAPFVDGRPTVTRTVPDGVTCPTYTLGYNGSVWGGGQFPVTVVQSWDPGTLAGEADFVDTPAPCGIINTSQRFSLTKIG